MIALVRQQYQKAEKLLSDHMSKLHELAKYLYERETITGEEFMEILNQKEEYPNLVDSKAEEV